MNEILARGESVVPDENLSIPHEKCPLCLSTGAMNTELVLQEAPEVLMLECQNCKGVTANRYPDNEFLESLYDSSHYTSDMMASTRPVDRCAKKIISKIDLSGRDSVRIVDYGGSKGYLSSSVIDLITRKYPAITIEAYVVDFECQLEDPRINFLSIDDFFEKENNFDVIILSAVLEHLPEYRKTMKKVINSWNKDGFLYIRTPYEAPLAKLLQSYKIRWPRHIHDMGSYFLENIFSTYEINPRLIYSAPSVIEADYKLDSKRFILALVLKIPGIIESAVLKSAFGYKGSIWKLVGGWEVVYKN
ncbi:MAG: hypothetical protein ACI9VT_001394 [Psychroserpens sp.]|jgi:hypothetical protein